MDINIEQIQAIIAEINARQFTLPPEILTICGDQGYSSPKVRELLHRLVSLPGANYLEIGVHMGSTFIPAVYKNKATATCIDNWSMFGNCRPQFEANLQELCPKRKVNIIENDCFAVDLKLIPPNINIYFFDGDHKREPQYKAFTYYAPVFAPRFIALVDDCNWEEPRDESLHALRDLRYRIEWSTILPAYTQRDTEQWWNGLFVAVINKDGNP